MTDKSIDQKILIGSKLKEARRLAGLSQDQVAKMISIPRPSVSEIESGNRRVSADELTTLCEIYDVSPDWVVGNSASTISKDNPRLELAARELSKLKDEDLDKLLQVMAAMRTDDEGTK
jgi:transcriptional regulator with XRE-family HTH domain